MGFSIGVDFGSLSARAMAVDVSNGRILKESVYGYPHGIMKESLPTGRKLEPGTALQDPRDYLDAWQFLIQDMFKDKELPRSADQPDRRRADAALPASFQVYGRVLRHECARSGLCISSVPEQLSEVGLCQRQRDGDHAACSRGALLP